MSTPEVQGGVAQQVDPVGHRSLRVAWVCLAFMPLSFVAAMFLGEGLLSMQGYESGLEQFPPIGVALLAAIPAIVVMIAPAVPANWSGMKANRHGVRSGMIPALVGVVIIAGALVTNTLPLLVTGR